MTHPDPGGRRSSSLPTPSGPIAGPGSWCSVPPVSSGAWVAAALGRTDARLWLPPRDPAAAGPLLQRFGADGEVVAVDLARDGDLEHLIGETRPAVVFNLAGYGVDRRERDPELAAGINRDVPRRLTERLLTGRDQAWTGLALVHVGTALEYGEIDGDLREEAEPRPTTAYGITKLAGTRLVERAAGRGLPAVTARVFTAYGPGEQAGRLLPTLLEAARGTERIALSDGTQRRDFTWIADIAAGLLRLGAHPGRAEPTLNLATGILTPVRRFIEIAADVLAIDPARLGFGDLPHRPEEMQHQAVNTARVERILGWRPPTTPQEGIQRTATLVASAPG